MAQVQHVKLTCPTGMFRLSIYSPQKICISLWIKHDNDFTTTDILSDQELRETRLAHARRTQHERMTDSVVKVHPDLALAQLNAVNCRIAAHRRYRPNRV